MGNEDQSHGSQSKSLEPIEAPAGNGDAMLEFELQRDRSDLDAVAGLQSMLGDRLVVHPHAGRRVQVSQVVTVFSSFDGRMPVADPVFCQAQAARRISPDDQERVTGNQRLPSGQAALKQQAIHNPAESLTQRGW